MIVVIDTEKLRKCCDEAEQIGTPVADIVETLQAKMNEINVHDQSGWRRCCDELEHLIQEGKK